MDKNIELRRNNKKTLIIVLIIVVATISVGLLIATNMAQRNRESVDEYNVSVSISYALYRYDGSIKFTYEKEKKGNERIVTYYANDSYTRGKYGSKLLVITYDKNYKVKNVEGNERLKKVVESSIN